GESCKCAHTIRTISSGSTLISSSRGESQSMPCGKPDTPVHETRITRSECSTVVTIPPPWNTPSDSTHSAEPHSRTGNGKPSGSSPESPPGPVNTRVTSAPDSGTDQSRTAPEGSSCKITRGVLIQPSRRTLDRD